MKEHSNAMLQGDIFSVFEAGYCFDFCSSVIDEMFSHPEKTLNQPEAT